MYHAVFLEACIVPVCTKETRFGHFADRRLAGRGGFVRRWARALGKSGPTDSSPVAARAPRFHRAQRLPVCVRKTLVGWIEHPATCPA